MIKAILVDVDGVLVHGRPADGKPWATFLEADLGVSPALLQQEFFTPYWEAIVTGQLDLYQPLARALARIAPGVSADAFITYWFENDALLDTQLLNALSHQRQAGIKVYLATNQEHLRASFLIEQLGLGQQCDGLFYSAALGYKKPDPRFYEKITDLSGFAPGQLLLLDDTPANVLAAKKLGWQAVEWAKGNDLAAIVALRAADAQTPPPAPTSDHTPPVVPR